MTRPFWTTDDAKTAPAQILLPDLLRILSNASLFTDPSTLIPMINSVQLESTGSHLVAVGTDRFMLGASAAPYADEKWATILPLSHVKTLITALKASQGINGAWQTVKLSLSPEGYRFKAIIDMRRNDTRENSEAVRLSFPTRKRTDATLIFPTWRKLVKDQGKNPETGVTSFSVDPRKMARFAKVTGNGYQMYVNQPVPNKAIQVRMGHDFVGLVMPVRINEDNLAGEDPKWL